MKKLFLTLMFLCGCASSVPPASGAKWFGAITPIQFSGDLSGDYTTQNVLKWRGKGLDATTMGAPTDAQIPIYVNGSSAWKSTSISGDVTISDLGVATVASSAKGITQLTGQVTAGPGFGSQAATITPGTAGQIFVSNATPNAAWTSLISYETTHGRFNSGGSGSDFSTAIGPVPGAETLGSAFWSLPSATTATATNYAFQGDGVNTYFNTIGGGGFFQFRNANATTLAKLANFSTNIDGLWLGHAATFSGSNLALLGDASTFASINAPTGGVVGVLIGGSSSVVNFAGGTQNGVALGSAVATGGHERYASGNQALVRNAGNTANNTLFGDDGANNLTIGNNYASLALNAVNQITGVAASTIAWESGADMFLDETTLHFRSAAHTEFMSLAVAASAAFNFNAPNATSGTIGWTAANAAGGNAITIAGQNAGGTNDGGSVTIGGGVHAGVSTADGSVKVTTPFNGGLLSFTPGTGTNTLTNAQSDANFVIFTTSAGGAFTAVFQRRIADTSCVWIRNNNGNTATISYLTGGTVTLATATSALVCSDSVNLQKVMVGT